MEIRKEELRKETLDTAQLPLHDAELEEASGGSATATGLIREGWICPGCRTLYGVKQSPCPKCGYES